MSEEDTKNLIDKSEESAEKTKIVKSKNSALEDGRQMNNFLGPMMKELEDAVAEQMKYLDQIEQDLLGDSKLEEYNRLIGHIPEEIRGSKSILTVLKNLGNLLNETVENENVPSDLIEKSIKEYIESKKNDKVELVKTEELIKLASFSSNLCSFLLCKYSHKNTKKIKLFTSKIYDSVNLWISKLFRFKNSALLFNDDETDGIVRLCSMLLNYKFNDYKENGFESIKKKPLIYISEASKYATKSNIETLAFQLGLPINCFQVLEVSKKLDDTFEKIDTKKFETNLEEEIKNNCVPMVLITSAGNRSGHCDSLNEINRICYKYRIWLHLDGFYLSTLALYSVPSAVQPIWSGDSVTLDLASWLGIPCLSYITIYRNIENSGTFIKPFNNYKTILQRSFPYWSILQAMGHDGVIERIRFSNEISNSFNVIIEKQQPCLKTLSFNVTEGTQTTTSFNSLSDLFVKALNFLTFVDLNNPVTIFKCDPKFVDERLFLKKDLIEQKPKRIISQHHQDFLNLIHENSNQKEIDTHSIYSEEIIDYTDSLTTWLYESINEKHNMEFELLEIENEGVCIRYCPIDHVNILNTTNNDLNEFSNLLEQLMTIIDASIRCKAKFDAEIKENSNLMSVKVAGWAGIGAFRYIPDFLMDKIDQIKNFYKKKSENNESGNNDLNEYIENEKELSEKDIKEINDLNELIVKKLQSEDSAFSSGQAVDGYLAIKFGMIQDIGLLKKIIAKVLSCSKEIEEASRFIETMSDLVRQGIEKANQDLKKETEQKLVQEGILRQIPLVGGLFSWISPSPSVNNVGRTFNLQSGKILTTETIYKYHIQVEENNNESNQIDEKTNLGFDRNLSSDTVHINDSSQISELSSDEQSNQPDPNFKNIIDLK